MTEPTENYYRPPEAPLEDDSLGEQFDSDVILNRLLFEQSFTRVFLASFIGSVLGVAFLALFLVTPGILFMAFALPGLITGIIVRYVGRALDLRYKLFSGAVAFLMYWLLIEFLNPSSVFFGFMLSVCNAVVSAYVCRRSLEPEEEAAVYFRRMGINSESTD